MTTLRVSCQFAGLLDGEAPADPQRCRLHDAAFLEGAPAGCWGTQLDYDSGPLETPCPCPPCLTTGGSSTGPALLSLCNQ